MKMLKFFKKPPIEHPLPSPLREIWEHSVQFHGRPCKSLAIGARACVTALAHLGLEEAVQMRLVCVTENTGCCVDALQIGLKCTTGTKHLLFYKTGRMIFTVYDLHTSKSVRMLTNPQALESSVSTLEILTMPEAQLFHFEAAHALTDRTLAKIKTACVAAQIQPPPRISGLQDSPDAFRQFDTQNNDTGIPRRSRF